MSDKPYKREQGDFELRILSDGRLVMIAPDETLMEIAKACAGDEAPGTRDEATASLPPPPPTHGSRPFPDADLRPQHLESEDAEAGTAGSQ